MISTATNGTTTRRADSSPVVPSVTIQTITPWVATDMLSANLSNRPLRRHHVKDLARAMKRGEWRLTHQGTAFDLNGRLIDGQHRLHAVIESDTPIVSLVTRGVDAETYDFVDVPIVRAAADMLLAVDPTIQHASLHSSVAAGMLRGAGQASPPKHAVKAFAIEYRDLIATFVDLFAKSDAPSSAGLIAAFCNAARDDGTEQAGGFPLDRVLEIATRYTSATFTGDDDPMKMLLFRMLKEKKGLRGLSKRNAYLITVAAVSAALEGRAVTYLRTTENDYGTRTTRPQRPAA